MSEKKVWFITGAGRGLGVDIAKSAIAAGARGHCHRPQCRVDRSRPG
jgi:NAD(P)-dependent dehydrogenase (short-subunit alcohol dehydrogenase family)